MAAFEAALACDVQMIELDVRLTKDRKVIVIHDETLDRTTDGAGKVTDHTSEELKLLDAGSWFHPRFADERLPLLEEVLDFVGDRAGLNIEIKATPDKASPSDDAIGKRVVELVKDRNLVSSTLISSFETSVLEYIATIKEAPSIAMLRKPRADQTTVDHCVRLNVFSYHPNHQHLTREQAQMMHEQGIHVFPYEIGTKDELQRVIQMGVDGVITGDPVMVKEQIGV